MQIISFETEIGAPKILLNHNWVGCLMARKNLHNYYTVYMYLLLCMYLCTLYIIEPVVNVFDNDFHN